MSNPTVCTNAENVLTMGVLNKIIEKSFHFDAGLDIEKKNPTHLVAFTVLGYPGCQRFPASAQSSPSLLWLQPELLAAESEEPLAPRVVLGPF